VSGKELVYGVTLNTTQRWKTCGTARRRGAIHSSLLTVLRARPLRRHQWDAGSGLAGWAIHHGDQHVYFAGTCTAPTMWRCPANTGARCTYKSRGLRPTASGISARTGELQPWLALRHAYEIDARAVTGRETATQTLVRTLNMTGRSQGCCDRARDVFARERSIVWKRHKRNC